MNTITLGDVVAGQILVTAEPHETVTTASKRMAAAYKGAVLVVSGGKMLGIFTERDLLIRVVAAGLDPDKTRMNEVMTSRLIVGRTYESYRTGMEKMAAGNCRHLPVLDGDRIAGMVSRRQLMALDIEEFEHDMWSSEPALLFI